MSTPSEKEFLALSKKGNLIPVYKEILGDLDSPVSAYYKLTEGQRHAGNKSFSFLLESVEGEEKIARYSFLATDPELVLESKDHNLQITRFNGKNKSTETVTIKDSPLTHLRNIMSKYKFVNIPGLPRFCGGMVGYIGYDTVRFFEKLPNKPKDDLKIPDLLLILAKTLVIFDHLNHRIKVVHCVEIKDKASEADKRKAYQNALATIDKLVIELKQPLVPDTIKEKPATVTKVKSNFTEKQYCNIVEQGKKYIKAGDIIQVVLSQRFEVTLSTDPFHVYRMLRALNPSPYMYYLHFGNVQIIGSSPELLVRCEDGVVETRPIAGTRKRGKNAEEDKALAKDLLADPKEKAEHIMLVDLGRNDLGRVCELGSVKISEFMNIEKYSHVMHIVSNVQGKLKKGQDAFDVLEATFPAGTVSGAPKIRAMEIIDELENVSRGPYAGCIGYFSFSGNFDSCITIRTIVASQGKTYIQAGAGIVADSDPKKEYEETQNKARAQILAIERAHQEFA
jgi:anthranilate synthase component 1